MSWYSKTSFLQTMQLSNLIVREKKKKETKKLKSIDRFKAFPLYSNILAFFGEQQSRWTLFGSQIMTFIPHELCISVFTNFVDYCGYILL